MLAAPLQHANSRSSIFLHDRGWTCHFARVDRTWSSGPDEWTL